MKEHDTPIGCRRLETASGQTSPHAEVAPAGCSRAVRLLRIWMALPLNLQSNGLPVSLPRAYKKGRAVRKHKRGVLCCRVGSSAAGERVSSRWDPRAFRMMSARCVVHELSVATVHPICCATVHLIFKMSVSTRTAYWRTLQKTRKRLDRS